MVRAAAVIVAMVRLLSVALACIQEKKLSVRDKIVIERGGDKTATVHKALVGIPLDLILVVDHVGLEIRAVLHVDREAIAVSPRLLIQSSRELTPGQSGRSRST
jgi:hypothetical protein